MRYILNHCVIPPDKDPTIIGQCVYCKTNVAVTIKDFESRIEQWKQGGLIQNVFPELSANDREFCISGLCSDCFNLLCDGLDHPSFHKLSHLR